MAWLLAVLLTPILGLITFGWSGELGSSGADTIGSEQRMSASWLPLATSPDAGRGHAARTSPRWAPRPKAGVLPLLPGNDVQVIEDYQGSIEAMTEAVGAAADFVHSEFYNAAWDEMTARCSRPWSPQPSAA
jgi:cardiolipin synthase